MSESSSAWSDRTRYYNWDESDSDENETVDDDFSASSDDSTVGESEKADNPENPDNQEEEGDEAPQDVELSKEQIAEIKNAFDANDADKDGRIEMEEMARAMRMLYQSPTEKQIQEMFLEMDTENVNSIDFEDFVSIMQRYSKDLNDSEKDLLNAFMVMDKMGRGILDADEFKGWMTQLGDAFSEQEVDEMLKELNVDKERKMIYEEFIGLVMRK